MNPGLLEQQITLLRQGVAVDELGQPSQEWTAVGTGFRARRMVPKAQQESQAGDRPNERTTMSFRVRSQPFITLYQAGDRVRELARTDFPETIWEITGWAEVEGTSGMYVDISCASPLR
ncbi:MAG: hypothetical protein JWO82_2491 [Akkermansiaceae bacterium]|nr:hypothetical protein [Akkermansiaceae bacterium]